MTRIQHLTTETIITATTIGFITILGILWYKNKKKNSVPTVWYPAGKVQNLYIYPLKSGRRSEVKTAICTQYGLQMFKSGAVYQLRDRNLIVFKEETREVQRHPKMLLIETTAYDENHFALNAPNMPELRVKIPSLLENSKTTTIGTWRGEKMLTLDCGDEAAKWLSNYVLENDSGLRLGFHNGSYKRDISEAYKQHVKTYPRLRNNTTGMYSNLTSYLLVNQASIDDLSNRIPESGITAHNFRPNILIGGEDAAPYSEDGWKWVKIGDAVFYSARLCTRCDFTTINPETTIKSENNEPLKTLRTYRQLKDLTKIELEGSRTVMGNNLGLHKEGRISVGDIIYVGRV